MDRESISSACDYELAGDAFESVLAGLGFRPPGSVSISPALVEKIADRIKVTIRNQCIESERSRRILAIAVLEDVLDEFDGLMCFQDSPCASSPFKTRGLVDFLLGSGSRFHDKPTVKAFVVECSPSLDGLESLWPQWMGALSAATNGGDFSQGAFTDGYRWIFATLTREDPPRSDSSLACPILRPKPKLVLSMSPCITAVSLDGGVDVASLRVVCQYLHVCLGDGFRKLASSHLLVPLASTDDDDIDRQ